MEFNPIMMLEVGALEKDPTVLLEWNSTDEAVILPLYLLVHQVIASLHTFFP